MSTVNIVDPSFVDRRNHEANGHGTSGYPASQERRQFGNSYEELTPDARDLALAVDQYKLHHRRRFVTYEELLHVLKSLGYRR
jgi:hypothetical protein